MDCYHLLSHTYDKQCWNQPPQPVHPRRTTCWDLPDCGNLSYGYQQTPTYAPKPYPYAYNPPRQQGYPGYDQPPPLLPTSWDPLGPSCWYPPTPAFEQPSYTYIDSYAPLQIPYTRDHREQPDSQPPRLPYTASESLVQPINCSSGYYPWQLENSPSRHLPLPDLPLHLPSPPLPKHRELAIQDDIKTFVEENVVCYEDFAVLITSLFDRNIGATQINSKSSRSYIMFTGGITLNILLEHWENASDPDVQVHRYLPRNMSYYGMMRRSRYCICPSGYEVASPRMVEGLYLGCVPVLIKEGYVVPFSDVLNWEKFAVIVPVKEIPNLKKILSGIKLRDYLKLQRRGIKMRRHFEVSTPPRRYDVFGMILHSIWLRRLNVRLRHDGDVD
ncbi:hypothetical protein SASPL_155176 [Salvia splendens]|uniref:Exostosin GT47 domain-containing protein n=1 Tax=Salvia splendens TaxID=180675 RepID=A0A8X8W1W9_SALSN|nr:hypothetical protein SASPL_155176 [Salvia splendens]